MRTVTDLLNLSGKVYVYLATADVCRRFYADAQSEGFSFSGTTPTQSGLDNIIAIHADRTLAHTGLCGHMAFQCKADGIVRVDYEAYLSGADDFIM